MIEEILKTFKSLNTVIATSVSTAIVIVFLAASMLFTACAENPTEPKPDPTPVPATPTPIPSAPILVNNAGNLLAMIESGNDLIYRTTNGIYKASKHDGKKQVLAAGIDHDESLAVDSSYAYYARDDVDALYKVSRSGGSPQLVKQYADLGLGVYNAGSVAVDSRHIYFIVNDRIYRIPLSGGAVELIFEKTAAGMGPMIINGNIVYGGADAIWYFDKTSTSTIVNYFTNPYLATKKCFVQGSLAYADMKGSDSKICLWSTGSTTIYGAAQVYGIHDEALCTDGVNLYYAITKGMYKYDMTIKKSTLVADSGNYYFYCSVVDNQYIYFEDSNQNIR